MSITDMMIWIIIKYIIIFDIFMWLMFIFLFMINHIVERKNL